MLLWVLGCCCFELWPLSSRKVKDTTWCVKKITVQFIYTFQVSVFRITFFFDNHNRKRCPNFVHMFAHIWVHISLNTVAQIQKSEAHYKLKHILLMRCSSATSLIAMSYTVLLMFLKNKKPVCVKSGSLVGCAVVPFQPTHPSGYLSLKVCRHVREGVLECEYACCTHWGLLLSNGP